MDLLSSFWNEAGGAMQIRLFFTMTPEHTSRPSFVDLPRHQLEHFVLSCGKGFGRDG